MYMAMMHDVYQLCLDVVSCAPALILVSFSSWSAFRYLTYNDLRTCES